VTEFWIAGRSTASLLSLPPRVRSLRHRFLVSQTSYTGCSNSWMADESVSAAVFSGDKEKV